MLLGSVIDVSIYQLRFYFILFWPCHMTCRILVPWPGIEPVTSAGQVKSPNHWTVGEFPTTQILYYCFIFLYYNMPSQIIGRIYWCLSTLSLTVFSYIKMDEEPIIYSITTLNQDFQQRHTPKNIKHKLDPNELPLTKKKLKHQKPCKRQHKNIAEDVNDEGKLH